MTRREQKLSSRDNYCAQQSSPQDKAGSQKVHSRDIQLENFIKCIFDTI